MKRKIIILTEVQYKLLLEEESKELGVDRVLSAIQTKIVNTIKSNTKIKYLKKKTYSTAVWALFKLLKPQVRSSFTDEILKSKNVTNFNTPQTNFLTSLLDIISSNISKIKSLLPSFDEETLNIKLYNEDLVINPIKLLILELYREIKATNHDMQPTNINGIKDIPKEPIDQFLTNLITKLK